MYLYLIRYIIIEKKILVDENNVYKNDDIILSELNFDNSDDNYCSTYNNDDDNSQTNENKNTEKSMENIYPKKQILLLSFKNSLILNFKKLY